MYITRAQRKALKRVYDRGPIHPTEFMASGVESYARDYRLTYRGFRRYVYPTFGCGGAVTVKWKGMWLAIETDGYVHS